MSIWPRNIYLILLSCSFLASGAMAQDQILKTPVADEDLRNDSLLAATPLPVPPAPNLNRVGVGGGELSLSLNLAIRRALENNNDIEVARDNVRLTETSLQSLEGVYDPLISFAPQLSNVRTPPANITGSAGFLGPIQQTIFSLTPSLTKQFSTGGGQYQFFFNSLRGTSNTTFTQLSPYFSTTLGATFIQPLWRDRSIDRSRHDIRVQRKRVAQSDADFRLQVIAVISQVQQAYWEFVFARRNEQNQLSNVNLAREQLRMIEEQISVGTSASLDRAQALTQIASAETAWLSATQYVTTAENVLKQLILQNKSASEWSMQLKPTDEPPLAAKPGNLKDALADAFANRPELAHLRVEQDINQIDTRFYKNQTQPRIDLQATVSTYGLAGNVLPGDNPPGYLVGGYGQALRNLANLNTGTISVGATIQFPLHNRTAKANLAGARIQGEQLAATIQSQEQAVEVDVRNALQAVEVAERQVTTARSASKSAQIQLAGELKRYQAGMSTTFLVFQFEDLLVNARTAELRAEANYNQALASLQRATSSTLNANHVTVDVPRP